MAEASSVPSVLFVLFYKSVLNKLLVTDMVYCLSHNLCPKNNSHWLAFQTVANLPTVIVLQGSSAKPHNLILTKCSCFFFVFIFCFSFWMNIYLNQWKYFWGKNSSASSSSSSSSSTPVSSSLTLQTQQSLSSWCWHICVSLKTQSVLIWTDPRSYW